MRTKRDASNRWRDYPLIGWLVAAVVVAVAHRWIPEATWLMIHLIVLGALTHAIMVWSAHFARSVLRTRLTPTAKRHQSWRLALLTLGSAIVLVSVASATWAAVIVGAALVAGSVVWHGVSLARDLRRALPGRFRVTVRYYLTAAAALPIGATFGVLLAKGLSEQWHARLLIAHTMTMLLGWVGCTVVGTLVTFWPTVLRTRMDDRAEALTRRAWWPLVAALVVTVGAALLGLRPVAVAGLGLYVAALVWWGRTLVIPARAKPPREFAAASIACGLVWFLVAVALTGWAVLTADDGSLALAMPGLAAYWVAGFALQILLGALSYLLPSVLGGGPAAVRAANHWFNRWATVRLTLVNGGLLLWLAQPPSWVRVTVSMVVLLAYLTFLPLMARGLIASLRARHRPTGSTPKPAPAPALTLRGLLTGVVALGVVASLGFALVPRSDGATAANVAPTGTTVEVTVEAANMAFTPDRIEAAAGDRVIITVVNTDASQVHDLQIAGQNTGRLDPGARAVLDLGVVGASTQGWCTIVGHRQSGMTLDLVVAGAPASGASDAAAGAAAGGTAPAPMTFDQNTPLSTAVDARAPEPTTTTDHRFTIETHNENLEVAPGVWQTRWVYSGGPEGSPYRGGSVGPTIRGRVGDTFEVTFVNNGDMSHAIDFHASNLAPDGPMRSIAPGEQLVYRFTAERAGAWLYHCGTQPMTAHIAGGMHGAVIIDPPGLAPVDTEYVLVQSEVYATPGTGDAAATAAPVDADRARAGDPDFVTFNGVADQYLQRPLTARAGERVRFWVVSAGPNRGVAFHIVGAQFDTVFHEGAYQLLRGRDAFGTTSGGSQVLDVAPASGGFVETVFPEPGHYTMVDHAMMNAERGARGIVAVS